MTFLKKNITDNLRLKECNSALKMKITETDPQQLLIFFLPLGLVDSCDFVGESHIFYIQCKHVCEMQLWCRLTCIRVKVFNRFLPQNVTETVRAVDS